MKKIISLMLITLCIFFTLGCTSNVSSKSSELSSSSSVTELSNKISDKLKTIEKEKENTTNATIEKPSTETQIEESEPVQEYSYNEENNNWYDYNNVSYTDNTSYNDYSIPTSGLTQQSGVNYHDGRTETYYSSNVLYHYRTSEWTVDNEGFYRDNSGNYVVAASDMPQGTTFETSKGTAMVYDSGCAEGITDFYTAW